MSDRTAAVINWIGENAASNSFAASLQRSLDRWGSLTDRQFAAVIGIIDGPAPIQSTTEGIKAALAEGVRNGMKRVSLRVGDYRFSLAGPASKNPGAVYVKSGGEYLGKIAADGRLFALRHVPVEDQQQIAKIAADPRTAAINHGKEFGECAICGRELSDSESVARGIGPVCAGKFGW